MIRWQQKAGKEGKLLKKGLILEGGAMRGLFSAGVMDVLMEAGIVFDGAIGVSAGAAFGCNYKSGQIGRVLRYNTRFCADKRYSGLQVLLREGNIFSASFCYDMVPHHYDPFDYEAYEKSPMEFYVVCSDIESGEAVYHRYEGRHDHGLEWIRASASMPLVSCPVEIEGRKYLDGGITDSIPVRFFERIGYDKNVVVLTQPEGYAKDDSLLVELIKLRYARRYPKLVERMKTQNWRYNETLEYIARREHAGDLLVIRPDQRLPARRVEKDPAKLKTAYEIGRRIASARLAEIRSYLG